MYNSLCVSDLELDLFSTPPESPDPYDDISSFPFIEKGNRHEVRHAVTY